MPLAGSVSTSRPCGRVHGSGTVWIEADRVIHGILKTLLAAKIPFCGFDGNVSEEKLNLLEFTSCLMAESCTCPAQVMWSKACQTAIGGSLFGTLQLNGCRIGAL